MQRLLYKSTCQQFVCGHFLAENKNFIGLRKTHYIAQSAFILRRKSRVSLLLTKLTLEPASEMIPDLSLVNVSQW